MMHRVSPSYMKTNRLELGSPGRVLVALEGWVKWKYKGMEQDQGSKANSIVGKVMG